MEPVRSKRYAHFIGVDVSKDKLDCVVLSGRKQLLHKEIANEVEAITAFIKELKDLPKFTIAKSLFGMEHTGIYINHLVASLKKAKANFVIEDALHIKNSIGKTRGKYDKIDAIRIATYLSKARDEVKLWQARRPVIEQLASLSTLRFRLIELLKGIQTPLKEQASFIAKTLSTEQTFLCGDSIVALKGDLRKVEKMLGEVVKNDERLKHLYELISSVPSIGPVTAIQIIITTNEYKDITDVKKYASYAGVAPFRKESGKTVTKARVSSLANKRVKALLHICSLTAVSRESELRDYYIRKTQVEGKPKMAVLNAIRYKLLLRVFACLGQDRCYQKDYVRTSAQHAEPVDKVKL